MYFNHASNTVTLHALRNISTGEEVTISYIQDNPYSAKAQRARMLTN